MGVYETRISNALSVKIFAVNVLRSMGIASKLVNADVYVYENGEFRLLSELSKVLDTLKYIDSCCIREEVTNTEISHLHIEGDLSGFGESFSISKYDSFENNLISLDKSSIKEHMELPAGEYVLATQNRLPNGNICAKYNILNLESDTENEVKLEYMQADINDMLSAFILPRELEERLNISENSDEIRLIMWMEEEEEPSQHIANDLLIKEDLLKNMKLDLIFTNEFENKDSAINELLKKSLYNNIHTNFGEDLQEAFGRSTFVNHETLPIVALCKGNRAVYAFSGYQVGSGNLIEKISDLIKEK